MFTGIIQTIGKICCIQKIDKHTSLCVRSTYTDSLNLGCSVAVDGVCLTLVKQNQGDLYFDVVSETLTCTTLSMKKVGDRVNLERSAKIGDEVGGHIVSGHVFGLGRILEIDEHRYTLQIPPYLASYPFEKGFIAIDGISLTLSNVCEDSGIFSVNLVPETVRRTTLGAKKIGEYVNIEFDMNTKIHVDVLQRMFAKWQKR